MPARCDQAPCEETNDEAAKGDHNQGSPENRSVRIARMHCAPYAIGVARPREESRAARPELHSIIP